MAKMMRKWMALAIALSLIANVVSLPAAADEIGSSDVQTVTVDLTNDAGEKIGEKTTTTTTDTQNTQNEVQTSTEEVSSWATQEVITSTADPVQDGNVTTEVKEEVVVDVTGQETIRDSSSVDKTTGTETLTSETTGSETTIVTDTTTTVTTTEDTQLDRTEEGPTTTVSGQVETGQWSEPAMTEEGQWQQTGIEEGEYVLDGKVTTTDNGTTDIQVDGDPLADKDAALTMTQEKPDDSEKLYISMEDALANDIHYTEGEQADGSVVTFIRNDQGDVIGYSIRKAQDTTPAEGGTGEIVTDSVGDMTADGKEIVTYTQPEGYTEGTKEILDDQGKVIGTITTQAILDEKGNIIGYHITEVTTVPSGALPGTTAQALPAPADTWTLPQKPAPAEPVTNQGLTTTQTVEDLYENGVHVGYEIITLTTDEKGNEVARESIKQYGTKTTYTSIEERVPESNAVTTTTVTTVYGTKTTQNYTQTSQGSASVVSTRHLTDEIYELVNTEEGMFLLLEGKVYAVEAIGSHGNMTMTSLQPDLSIDPAKAGQIDTDTDLRGAAGVDVNKPLLEGYDVQYVGAGLESRIQVRQTNGGNTTAQQFVLKDRNGNLHYVYCVDLNTTAVAGTSYNMVNVKDSGYFTESVAKKVEAIAVTGYWGTASGTGSLENLKQFMRDNKNLHDLTDEEIDKITEGMALSGTQAALWRYGHSETSSQMGADATGSVYDSSRNPFSTRNPTSEEKKLVNAIYNALIQVDTTNVDNNTTELLNTDNFATETTLVIKEKAANEDGTVKTRTDKDGTAHDVYVTDVYFTVDVKESDLTGNLVITIVDELGNTLATRQLATEDSNFLGKRLTKYSVNDDNVEFLIEDVELAEGVKINLNLKGAQNLEQGAYLYTAAVYTTSQTFVSVASGSQQVNLNVQMQFDVTDPQAAVKHTTKSWNEKKVDTLRYTKTDKFASERNDTITDETVTVTTEVTGTIVRTDVETSTTKTQRDWSSRYQEVVPGTGGDGDPGDPGDGTPDGDVTMAKVPKTGDLTILWAIIALVSLAGAAMLSRKETAR